MRTKRLKIENAFKIAIESNEELRQCYRVGLQALGVHSKKINLKDHKKLEGSVDLDNCLKALYPNESRWDYLLGYNEKLYYIEVHTANTREVKSVVKKLRWLKDWINLKAPELNKLKSKSYFVWIQSKNFQIPKTSPQYRVAASHGIRPMKILELI